MSNFALAGIEDLTGQSRGTLRITSVSSLRPVRWNVQCEKCGTATVRDHMALQSGKVADCPNSACGVTSPAQRSTLASIGGKTEAIRSRDSDEVTQHFRQTQTQQQPVAREFRSEDFQGADPDILRHYLDHRDRKQL